MSPRDVTFAMADPTPGEVTAHRAAAWRRAEKGSAALLAALRKHHPGRDQRHGTGALRLNRASRRRVGLSRAFRGGIA
jgi:hypothetical protein